MKRRDFLVGSGSLAGAFIGGRAFGQTRPCPPPSISVAGGASATTSCDVDSAEADWLARSTGPGVVWAHDFREPKEFSNFLQGAGDSAYTNPPKAPMQPYIRQESRFGSSGVLVSKCYGTTLARPISSADTVFEVVDASTFPDPAVDGTYNLLTGVASDDGTQEFVLVTGKSGNKLTVRRGIEGTPTARSAGTGVGSAPVGSWIRPMTSLPAGQNGRSVPDQGVANGFRVRSWDASNPYTHYRYRWGYWGHQSYMNQYDDNWPDNYGRSLVDIFEGTEFYLQFRMKVDAARFLSPAGKLFYLQNCSGSTSQQLFFNVYPKSTGHQVNIATNWGNGPILTPKKWDIPDDRWVTYLIHMKPGRNTVPETVLNIHAAIDGATEYTALLSGSAFPWNYSMPPDLNPPAFNSFSPTNYANAYVGSGSTGAPTVTNALEYTQIILSRQFIDCPKS